MWRRLRDYPLDTIAVGSVDTSVGVAFVKIADTVLQESSSSLRGRHTHSFDGTRGTARVFDIKYSDFCIARGGNYSPIGRVRHEFHTENVCAVAGGNGSGKSERGVGVGGLV